MATDKTLTRSFLRTPWLGAIALLGAALFTLIAARPEWQQALKLESELFTPPYPEIALCAGLICWLVDLLWFQYQRRRANNAQANLATQLDHIKQSKRQLQQKAQRHSNQTEKLKAFIGDKLLEYIEYDEKYLHFKGIAAEVRHNGVISYDKIQQALRAGQRMNPQHSGFEQALISLSYLWDLLDLSTADNMALHINNHICDCEEYFYQQQLEPDHKLPFVPTFFAHQAIYRALEPCLQGAASELSDTPDIIRLGNDQFQCYLDHQCQLLGNENHIVLAAENLIKNALYFHGQQSTAAHAQHQRVVISLTKNTQAIQLSVYNHGPHIPDSKAQQIYQLGFTTRTEDQIHGKGLGLYFVKQIVAGYEGQISHRNVVNQPESYSLRLELQGQGFEGNEIQTEVVDVQVRDGKPSCINKTLVANDCDAEQPLDCLQWAFRRPLRSIEITAHSNGKTHTINLNGAESTFVKLEPSLRHPPRWALSIASDQQNATLSFIPLDVTGVEFLVQLPLADAQQDTSPEEQQDDAYIETIADRFKPFDQLPRDSKA